MKSLPLFCCSFFTFSLFYFSANAQLAKDWDECKWLDIATNEQQHAQFIEQQKLKNTGTHVDNSYDLIYEQLRFNINPNVWFIHGNITFYFKPVQSPFSFLVLDCSDSLIVDSVFYHQQKMFFQRRQPNQLVIDFFADLPTNVLDSFKVYYHGKPIGTNGFGAFQQHKQSGSGVIWTLSEPYGASDWMPCKQSLNDKIDSIDVYISAPDSFKSVSNGLRQSIIPQGFSTNLTHWKHRYPIATYLIAIACTNYDEYSDWVINGNDSLRIQNFFYHQNDSINRVNAALAVNVMKFYESKFGAYPFRKEKYGHAQFGWGGGMEHQTQTFVSNFGFGLIAHEMAHQWFGDKSTCHSWAEIWLNEGFATYCSALSSLYLGRQSEWDNWRFGTKNLIINALPGSVFCDDTTSVARIFNNNYSYQKGAWILHMLRYQMGDTLFFKAMHDYIQDPKIAYNYTSTEILKQHFETYFGKPLDTFFQIYYYGKNLPEYRVRWWQTDDTVRIHVDYISNQTPDVYWSMPLNFTCRSWDDNKQQDSDFIFSNTSISQDYKIIYPHHLGQLLFDFHTSILAKVDLVKSPEAGYNYAAAIQLTPNPARDEVFINEQKYGVTELKFYDVTGKLVWQINQNENWSTNNIYGNLQRFDISNLEAGFYIVQMRTNNNLLFYQKLIKQ